MRNRNKIFYAKTEISATGRRDMWLISSPTREEVEKRFNSLFTAFKYGCPPHGGMALGIDRILMIIKDETNLREVQAFPTSTSGQDLMMGSPSVLMPKQLEELGIKIKEE